MGTASSGKYIPIKEDLVEKKRPKGWPESVQYTNVCNGKNYRASPLKNNENKLEIREIDKFEDNNCCSNTEDSNYGVFAVKKINKGETICEYTGILRTHNEKNENSRYTLCFNQFTGKKLYIDAESCGNSSRFINDYHNIGPAPNVTFAKLNDGIDYKYKEIIFEGRVIVKANQDIMPDTQLLVFYGDMYCKKWGII